MGHPRGTRGRLVVGAVVVGMLGSMPTAQAATPQTFEIVAGRELAVTATDGTQLSAVTVRFLPDEIEVHRGDILRFTSEVPLQGIALLPPTIGPGCEAWTLEAAQQGRCQPRMWLEDHAFSLESSWYPITLDPDERFVKVNNAVAFPPFPPCGNPGQRRCSFPLSPHQQDAQDTRWGFSDPSETPEDAKGVLNSGMGQGGDRTVDFTVEVTADPGTEFWAVSPFAKEAHLRVRVVGDEEPIPSPAEVRAAGEAQWEADRATAAALDARYSRYRKQISLERGVATWEALLGVEDGPVAIRQAYPKILQINRGDKVRWVTDRVANLVHTVTFPGEDAHDPDTPLFTTRCDLDGDEGGHSDVDPTFAPPLFCPGGHTQVEFDLSPLIGAAIGDGTFRGPGDNDHSGVRGMAPALIREDWETRIVPQEPYELRFAASSPDAGFAYACALHGALNFEMSGRIVVR